MRQYSLMINARHEYAMKFMVYFLHKFFMLMKMSVPGFPSLGVVYNGYQFLF